MKRKEFIRKALIFGVASPLILKEAFRAKPILPAKESIPSLTAPRVMKYTNCFQITKSSYEATSGPASHKLHFQMITTPANNQKWMREKEQRFNPFAIPQDEPQ